MSNKVEATFHGPPLITDHTFRTTGAQCNSNTGRQGGLVPGMCAWLGTCNKPESAHAKTSGKRRRKTTQKEGAPLT